MIREAINWVNRQMEKVKAAKQEVSGTGRSFNRDTARGRARQVIGKRADRLTTKQLTTFAGKPTRPDQLTEGPRKPCKGHRGKPWRRLGPVYRSKKLAKRLRGGW